MTQVACSKALGRSQSFVSDVERGVRRLDVIQLRDLCRVLKQDLVTFVRQFETAPSGPLIDDVANGIVFAVERLRSRSIASRYMSITGRFRAEMAKISATFGGVGLHRAISVTLSDGTKFLAYPIVGIPTAELLNDIENKSQGHGAAGTPILIYDHIGIREAWAKHLTWLDGKIRSVRAVKVAEAAWILAAWEA
jgi:hypothetical protein